MHPNKNLPRARWRPHAVRVSALVKPSEDESQSHWYSQAGNEQRSRSAPSSPVGAWGVIRRSQCAIPADQNQSQRDEEEKSRDEVHASPPGLDYALTA